MARVPKTYRTADERLVKHLRRWYADLRQRGFDHDGAVAVMDVHFRLAVASQGVTKSDGSGPEVESAQ